MKVAGGVALAHLPNVLRVTGINIGDIEGIEGDPRILFNTATFDDVIRLTARQLGVGAPTQLKAAAVRESLHQTVAADDYFVDHIDSLPITNNEPLQRDLEQTLDLGVRLANATWKVGQVHRAAWEGNDGRIDPTQREVFNPYDLLKHDQYVRLLGEGRTPDEALLRVAFEVWKDLDQLRTTIKYGDMLLLQGFHAARQSRTYGETRSTKAAGYPDRLPVAEGTTWEDIGSSYQPPDYTAAVVRTNDRTADPSNPDLWADPEDPHQAKGAPTFSSYEGRVRVDERGRPLNPTGPTGLEGRGLLGNWGANNAADPIVTRINAAGQLEMIVIQRRDTGEWALPGGMVNRDERVTATLQRELSEEAAARLDFKDATPVYQGYVDDPRNTDNAWIETDAYHLHLPEGTELHLQSGDDAQDARWMVLSEEAVGSLYASHADLVQRAIALWQDRTGVVVGRDGRIGVAA